MQALGQADALGPDDEEAVPFSVAALAPLVGSTSKHLLIVVIISVWSRNSRRSYGISMWSIRGLDSAPLDKPPKSPPSQMDLKREIFWVDADRGLATPRRMVPTSRPATIFVLLSLAFGSIIVFTNPPLRGPDEIAHFLRIYSYARGELLPVTENNSRKGIFVSSGLYNQLYFFKTAGEVFARSTEEGMRYGHIGPHEKSTHIGVCGRLVASHTSSESER